MVKPDHLGDLILASPAVRAMAASYPDLTLFVSSRSRALARWLFPTLEMRSLDLPHLAKADAVETAAPDLTTYDAVAFLRRDGVMTPQWADLRTRRHVMFVDDQDVHQSLLDYGVAREFSAAYDIDAHFFADAGLEVTEKARRAPRRVGLSIGSGFYTNAWPLLRWIELAKALTQRGIEVFVVCGPAEATLARVLIDGADLGRDRLILGGPDFAAFSSAVSELDLVVGSDGGTAHLCSLTTPVLSIFGSSPVRRYAPFGRMNAVLSQMLNCSPCIQYAARLVNGCVSVECMAAITAARRAGRHGLAHRALRPALIGRAARVGVAADRTEASERRQPLGPGRRRRRARKGGCDVADVTPPSPGKDDLRQAAC